MLLAYAPYIPDTCAMRIFPKLHTRRNTPQARLRQQLAMYRTVADFTFDLEIWVNPEGGIRYMSPSCMRITGYPAASAWQASCFFSRLIHPDDFVAWNTAMIASKNEDIPSMDFRILRADGLEVWLAQETTRVLDPKGDFQGLRLSLRDVTDRVRAHKALDESKLKLEERVRERTAELERSRERYKALSGYLQESTEKERTRISREIHDILGQDLTALNMGLHRLERSFQEEGDPRQAQATELRALIAGTLDTVRRISRELRPPILDELGFAEAIAWRARSFQEATGINVQITMHGKPQLTSDEATALYRVFQETLTNVARHSGATALTVHLRSSRAGLRLKVADNGRGMPLAAMESPDSLGIIGMRERLRAVGGHMDILCPSPNGTLVCIELPARSTTCIS